MFCTACGNVIPAGQPACPHCGHRAAFENPARLAAEFAPAAPPQPTPPFSAAATAIPQMQFAVEHYRNHIKILAIAWFAWAGLSLLAGFAGLSFARLFFMGHFHYGMHGPIPPEIIPMAMHLAWIAILIRAALALASGWGLIQHARWGRIFAIFVAIVSLFRFPLETALGIWTLVVLLGARNAVLYEQL